VVLTPAGIEDLLLSSRATVLLVDEINRINVAVLQHLLPVTEGRPLRVLKANKTTKVEVRKLVGAVNVERRT